MRALFVSVSLLGLIALAGCAGTQGSSASAAPKAAPASAAEALRAYYDTLPASMLPVAPAGKPLPDASKPLTRILLASCNNEESESATLATVAAQDADLFLMIGDNVYGDTRGTGPGRSYAANDPDLSELRRAFAELATRPEFLAVRARLPMMVTWDDHDFGANDAGAEFPFKEYAERIHETFWGLDEQVRERPGVHYSRIFGPEGKRTQIIMLDTRFFRSALTPTDAYGTPGKERYLPALPGTEQVMLGEDQWAWLAAELRKPAEVRLIASSIQVITDGHGWEAWKTMPAERERLYRAVRDSGAKGVVFLSGDRHTAFLYRNNEVLAHPALELTASSLNMSFATESKETDASQIGAGYPMPNFGDIAIDWDAGTLTLAVRGQAGEVANSVTVPLADIGAR